MKFMNYKTVVVLIVLTCLLGLVFVWLGWTGHAPPWTGFGEYIPPPYPIDGYQPPKTVWNLLELIIIPAFLTLVAYAFTESQRENERRISDNHIYAARMQSYLDQMTELLLEKGLNSSDPTPEVRSVARAHTITTLLEIDGKRKGRLLQFLFETGLIDAGERIPDITSVPWKEKAIVSLKKADLSHADLKGAFLVKLCGVDLICANLEEADLRDVRLSGAHLFEANMRKANLRGACLRDTDLRNATLCDADLRGTSLRGADLRGADFSGFKWDNKTDFVLTRRDNTKGIEEIHIPPSPLEEGGE